MLLTLPALCPQLPVWSYYTERNICMRQNRILALVLSLLLLFLTACGADMKVPDSSLQESASTGWENEDPSYYSDSPALEAEDSPQISDDVPQTPDAAQNTSGSGEENEASVRNDLPKEGEAYYDVKNVVLYLELYGGLPPNYITKDEARDLGWQGGSVEKYKEGAAIGGDRFGNHEGQLPTAKGRHYTECDIDTDGYHSRGSRRLIFSNDGLYYYTSDHYETFSEVTVTEDYEVRY